MFSKRYVPNVLSKKDKIKQKKELMKSIKAYKKGNYYVRDKVDYPNKRSKWYNKTKKKYNLNDEEMNLSQLSKATKCKKSSLKQVIRKGMGAYYSSGSRPNQTPQSWGIARLYSAISGGPAYKYDQSILKKGCKSKSKIFKIIKK